MHTNIKLNGMVPIQTFSKSLVVIIRLRIWLTSPFILRFRENTLIRTISKENTPQIVSKILDFPHLFLQQNQHKESSIAASLYFWGNYVINWLSRLVTFWKLEMYNKICENLENILLLQGNQLTAPQSSLLWIRK